MINGLYAYFGTNRFQANIQFAELNVQGAWNSTQNYLAAGNDAVFYGGNGTYIALIDNSNAVPNASTNATRPAKWSPLVLISSNPAPVGITNVQISGNTGGTTSDINGQLILAGGSNITVSQDGNTVSFVGGGGAVISAGTNAQNTGTVVFSNSNGVSFGLNTNGVLTASAVGGGGGGGAAISAGTNSQNTGTVSFKNSNGVSFGLDVNGSLTATVKTDYQTSGAYLTTAMQSNAATISNVKISAGTTSSNVSAVTFSNGSGVSWGYDGTNITATVKTDYQTSGNYLTTAMQSNAATISNVNVSAGTTSTNASAFTFSNSNGVSFGIGTGASAGVVTATVATNYQSQGAYLTTAALSSQTLQFTLGGNVATTNSSQIFNGGFILAGGNSLTIQQSNNSISLSVGNYLTTAMQSNAATISNVNVSAGTTSTNASAFTFSNSNGVSFGIGTGANVGVVTATVQTNYLTTACQSACTSVFAKTGFTSTTTAGTAIVGTHNTDGLSLGVPVYLTTAMQSNAVTISNVNISAGTTSTNASAFTFSNSNGVSFGIGTGGSAGVVTATVQTNYLTTAALSTQTLVFSLGGNSATTNSSQISNGGFVLAGGNSLTIQQSNNTISFSVGNYLTTAMQSNAATISNVNVSAGTTSTNASAFTFSNSNGVSFGIGTGANVGVVTATVQTNYLTTACQSACTSVFAKTGFTSTTTAGTAIVGTHDTNGLSLGVPAFITTAMLSNAATISNVNISAGTTSTNASAFTFANANGISFGLGTGASAGSITATVQTNYLTTAALSSQTLVFSLGGNSATTNSSQISNGGFVLAGGNSLTIQQSNNTISLSVGNYLTTAMQSNAATISNVNISAGTTSTNASAFTFSNSNGVSFGIGTGANVGVITASAAGGAGAAISAGTNSQNTGTVSFKDGNGVTFGLDTNGSLTATVKTDYLTTAALSSQTLQFTLGGNVATTNSSQIFNGGFILAGGNSLTIQQSNNSISLSVGNYLTTAALSSQTLQFTLGGNVATTNSSQILNGGFILAGGNSLTIQQSNNSISLSVGNYLTTACQSACTSVFAKTGFTSTTTAGTAIVGTHDTNGLSLGVPAFITTAITNVNMSAGTTSTNASAFTFSNANGISFGIGTGANVGVLTGSIATSLSVVNFSVVGSSNNLGSVVFSNSNNLTFGLNASTITASYNGIDIGISTGGNTSGTSGTFNDGNLQYVFAAVSGITLSQSSNGSSVTLSVAGPGDPYCGYFEPYPMTNTAQFTPGAGSWYFAPFVAPQKISGGRINLLHVNTSTASLFMDITGASYVSSSTGSLQQSYTYSKAVALYSQGAGANSTRLESFWSNSFSFGWSKIVNVSVSNASNINLTVAHSISYISEIGSNGAYTLNQFASAISSTVANSSTASTALSNAASSIRNMLSNSIIEVVGFNTTIQPGAYWLAFAYSTTRASAGTGGQLASALDFSVSSEVGISRLLLEISHRNWGSTNTTPRSHIMPYGLYTGAANMAPPQFVVLSSDLSSNASAWIPYFNFQNQGITK